MEGIVLHVKRELIHHGAEIRCPLHSSTTSAIIAPWRLIALLASLRRWHCFDPSGTRPDWRSCAGSRPARLGWWT